MFRPFFLALLTLAAFAPLPASAHHTPLCTVAQEWTSATVPTAAGAVYLRASQSGRTADVALWRETNGEPGLQTFAMCGHAPDQLVAHACPGQSIDFPGDVWCVLSLA